MLGGKVDCKSVIIGSPVDDLWRNKKNYSTQLDNI